MSHLPPVQLHKWEGGQPISAAVLNHDFTALRDLADYAADLAVTPDPAGTEALQRVASAEARIAALEHRNEATARELGERQYTPLAAFGSLVLHVNALADPLHKAAQDLSAEAARRTKEEERLEARMASVESAPKPPPAPSIAEFEQLRGELEEARAEASAARYQVQQLARDFAALRHETAQQVAILGKAAGIQYTQLLARMDTFEASTAAADVEAMRAEVARLQRTIDDTDRKAALHKLFTPRAAFAYLMKRVERLEKRP